MFYEACQAKMQKKLLIEICPECGAEIEMEAAEPFGVCEECGTEIRNQAMDCLLWCENAVSCAGEEAVRKARESEEFLSPELLPEFSKRQER